MRFKAAPILMALAVAGCAPDLPDEPLSAAAERTSALDTATAAAFERLAGRGEADWLRRALETNRRLDESLGTCFADLRAFNGEVDALLDAALQRLDEQAIAPEWEALAARLPDTVASCVVVFEDRESLTRPVRASMNREPPSGPRAAAGGDDAALAALVAPGRDLTRGLAGYYAVLEEAAQGGDLADLKAESEASAEALTGILAVAAEGVPLGSTVQTLGQSVITLVAEIEDARRTAARYDAILAALEAVDPQDLELIEDVIGVTLLATLAGTVEAMALDELTFAVRRFNLIDPRAVADSEAALRHALATADNIRTVAGTDIFDAVGEIAEAHARLTEKVRARDGETAATLRRIRAIGRDADDVAEATAAFIEGGAP